MGQVQRKLRRLTRAGILHRPPVSGGELSADAAVHRAAGSAASPATADEDDPPSTSGGLLQPIAVVEGETGAERRIAIDDFGFLDGVAVVREFEPADIQATIPR